MWKRLLVLNHKMENMMLMQIYEKQTDTQTLTS